jgi:tRNA (cmo5U34)-methyltransferase
MEDVKHAFDSFALEYDTQRAHVIPEFQQFYGAAVWAAESTRHAPRILDIGAGTGMMSGLLLQKFPAATIVLLDFSERMLDVARQRFAGRPGVEYRLGDYRSTDLEGPYNIIVSALSIHHLESGEKPRLFERICAALMPGGIFVNADQADGETPYFTRRYLEYWDEYLASGPLAYHEHEEIQRRRDRFDRDDPVSHQLRWLREAGFHDVDLVYRNRTFIVTAARK